MQEIKQEIMMFRSILLTLLNSGKNYPDLINLLNEKLNYLEYENVNKKMAIN